VDSRADADTFEVGAAAKKRRDEWLTMRRDARQKYDTADYAEKKGSTAGGSGSETAFKVGDAAEKKAEQAEEKKAEQPAGAEDPFAAIARGVKPYIEPPILKRVEEIARTAGGDAAAAKDARDAAEEARKAVQEIDKRRQVQVVLPQGETRDIDGDTHEKFDLLLKVVGAGENVLMAGPAGSGKTTAATQVAQALGMELYLQPVALDKFEATGFIDAGGAYRGTAVRRWAEHDGDALLLLDEVDAWSPDALVALNPIIDNKIGVFPDKQFEIKGRKAVIFTANTWGLGADADYCGRNKLDAASLDRCGARIDWGYDEAFERKIVTARYGKDADKVVTASQKIRARIQEHGIRVVWGPRQTLGLAARTAIGMTLKEALELSALASTPELARKKVLAGIS
jgi:MoxR-like ATPase